MASVDWSDTWALSLKLASLASIVRVAFGPYGRALLMEHSGQVVITRDGSTMLSFLEVDDFQAKAALSGLLQSARIRGDGSKISLLLLARLLDQLHCRGESGATTQERAKWCNVIIHARDVVMPRLRQDFLCLGTLKESELDSVHNSAKSHASQPTKMSEVIYEVSKCFLETKFPLAVSETIARLASDYHCLERKLLSATDLKGKGWLDGCSGGTSMLKIEAKFVEVFNAPFSTSHVEEGFIITRTFKYATEDIQDVSWQISCVHNMASEFKHEVYSDGSGVQKSLYSTPCKGTRVALWSIMLEENEDGPKAVIEPEEGGSSHVGKNSSPHPDTVLLGSLLSKHAILRKGMDKLKELDVKVIFSSVYFPDWAVSCCQSYGICLVDMIDEVEWQCLQVLLNIQPLNSVDEIYDIVINAKPATEKMLGGMQRGVFLPSQIGIVPKVERYIIGNASFVRLVLKDIFQLVLCGPTVTMCKQYSNACLQLFRYLENWLEASLQLTRIRRSGLKDCRKQEKVVRKKTPDYKDTQNGGQEIEKMVENISCRFDQALAGCSDTHNHTLVAPSSSVCDMNTVTHEGTTKCVYIVPCSGYQELFVCCLLQSYINNGKVGVECREPDTMSGLAMKKCNHKDPREEDGIQGIQEMLCKVNCDEAQGEKRNVNECKRVLSLLNLQACTILLNIIEEVPKLLHVKASKASLGKYVNYHLQRMEKFSELVNGRLCVMEAMDGFEGCQSPFVFFEILEMVLTMALVLLRVDSVVKSRERVKEVKK